MNTETRREIFDLMVDDGVIDATGRNLGGPMEDHGDVNPTIVEVAFHPQ